MSKQWIKLWKEKLLASLNFQRCTFLEKATYSLLLLYVRDDGQYAGKLCYPNGLPLSEEEFIKLLNLKRGTRTDRIKQAIASLEEKGMIYYDENNVLCIRKYAELIDNISKTSSQLPSDYSNTSAPLSPDHNSTSALHPSHYSNTSSLLQETLIDNQQLNAQVPSIEEEKEEEKEEDIDKDKDIDKEKENFEKLLIKNQIYGFIENLANKKSVR